MKYDLAPPASHVWGAWEDEIEFYKLDPVNWRTNYLKVAYRYIIRTNEMPPEPTNFRTPPLPTGQPGEGPPPPSATPPSQTTDGRGPPAEQAAPISPSQTTHTWGEDVPDVPAHWGPKVAFGYRRQGGWGEHYCIICGKVANDQHCESARHLNRIKDPMYYINYSINHSMPLMPGMPLIGREAAAAAGSVSSGEPRPMAPPTTTPDTNLPRMGSILTPMMSGRPNHLPSDHPAEEGKTQKQ